MFSVISEKIKNFILPKFSEIEILILFYLFIILMVDQISAVFAFISGQLSVDGGFTGIIVFLLFILGIPLLVTSLLFGLAHNLLLNKESSQFEKRSYSIVFYAMLSCFGMISSVELASTFANKPINQIELIFMFYLLTRSLVQGFVLMLFVDKKKEDDLTSQVIQTSINRNGLLTLLVVTPAFYEFLKLFNTPVTAATLTFFYLGSIVLLIQKLASRNIIFK